MKINRRSGMAWGKSGDDVYYSWRGLQCARKAPEPYQMRNSPRFQDIKVWFSEGSYIWNALPDALKGGWELYAGWQGSASDIESNQVVCYQFCPIPNYPPRPKLMTGKEAFVGAYVSAKAHSISGNRFRAPLGQSPPPAPRIDARYERSAGELVINVATANVAEAEKVAECRAILWVTIRGRGKIVYQHQLDCFDVATAPTKIERRYRGYEQTMKDFGYKPLVFAEMDYLTVSLAGQTMVVYGDDLAPVVSASSNIPHFYIINDPKLAQIEDLINSGQIKNIWLLNFNERFMKKIARIREAEFVKVKGGHNN